MTDPWTDSTNGPSLRALWNAARRKTEICAMALGMTPREYCLRKALRDAREANDPICADALIRKLREIGCEP
jgi:hypothetical protein